MFSNTWRSLIALFVATAVGCGLNTGEKAPPAPIPTYSGNGYSCVGKIPEFMGEYLNNTVNESEITKFVRCLQNSLTSFASMTRGRRHSTYYLPNEIREFLQDNFLRDRPISDQLLHEFMVIKQVMVGGETDRISRQDLMVAIDILEDFRLELLRLKPHLPILNPNMIQNQDPHRLGQNLASANDALKQTVKTFSERLQNSKRRYPYKNLETFVTEFRNFVRWEEHFPKAIKAELWVGFLKQFKIFAVSPEDEDAIRTTDWAPLLTVASRWYLTYLGYKVGIQGQAIKQGIGLQNAFHLTQEVFSLMEEAVQNQPTKVISHKQLSELIRSIQLLGWLPSSIRATSIEAVMKAVVDRIFGNENVNPAERRFEGLTLTTLSRMKQEFYRWGYVQLNLDGRYRSGLLPSSLDTPSLHASRILSPDIRRRLDALNVSDWDEFMKIKDLMRPLYPEGQYSVFLVPLSQLRGYALEHEFHNLSMMNLLRSIVTLIFRGYSADYAKAITWGSGLRSEEMQRFYEDFRDLAVDLEFADRRNVNTGTRAFVEGNLFTYAADGFVADAKDPRSRLSFIEAVQLFGYLYSGGTLANQIYEDLAEEKCKQRSGSFVADVNRRPKVAFDCVSKELRGLISQYAVNMPGLQTYVRRLDNESMEAYARVLLKASSRPHPVEGLLPTDPAPPLEWIERSDFATLAVLLHYGESVLTRFDADYDGALNFTEITQAIPIFSGYIQKFVKDRDNEEISDTMARRVVRYILIHKEFPGAETLVSKSWWWFRNFDLGYDIRGEVEIPYIDLKIRADLNREIKVDRLGLAKVFQLIISKLMETPPATVRPVEASAKAVRKPKAVPARMAP